MTKTRAAFLAVTLSISALLACSGTAWAHITERVSVASAGVEGDDWSDFPSISSDGRYVAFESIAANLVPGDTNDTWDVFVHDRLTGTTERVSVSGAGVEGDDWSDFPSISADGRYVAFESLAGNLSPGDTNNTWDIFVHDRLSGTTQRVSVAAAGIQVNDASVSPSISGDGRYVAFESDASDLVTGDTNATTDVFVRDRTAGITQRVSVSSAGSQGTNVSGSPVISADGGWVAFASDAADLISGDTNGATDVFVRGLTGGTTERVSVSTDGSEGDSASFLPVISVDGSVVGFVSEASNLVAGDTNGVADAFVRDLASVATERVSLGDGGAQGNGGTTWISLDAVGRLVCFGSESTDLVTGDTNISPDVFVYDRQSQTTERVSVSSEGTEGDDWSDYPCISGDGRYVAFDSFATDLVAGDANDSWDVFVRDLETDATSRVSVATTGMEGNGESMWSSVSADGRYVAYSSAASNLVPGDTNGYTDIFLRDLRMGTTERASVATDGAEADNRCDGPSLSGDGRYLAFSSSATNLVPGDSNDCEDVFVRDLVGGITSRVSVATAGTEGNDWSGSPSISADGRYVAFMAAASTLVSGDTNGVEDIFVHDRQTGTTSRVSVATAGTQALGQSNAPSMSANGRFVAFASWAGNLVNGDTNGRDDVFVRDLQAGSTQRVSVSTAGTQANDPSGAPSISGDGRYVAFWSMATNLVAKDTNGQDDVFVRDRQANTTQRVSVTSTGIQGNQQSQSASISADGRHVAFDSWADNLVSGDTNNTGDVFVRDLQAGTTHHVSASTSGIKGNGSSNQPAISGDGRVVTFFSTATNLVPGDTSDRSDVFVAVTTGYSSYRGLERYDTALKLSQAAFPTALPPGSGLVLAPGETFPEALCGAPLAAAWGGPVLLHPKSGLNKAVMAEVKRLAPSKVFVIGFSTTVVNLVKAALPGMTVTSITAANVYDLSRSVANELEKKVGDMTAAAAILTSGDKFPDAIGVSPLACAKLWPILLTPSTSLNLHPSAAGALSDLGITQAIKVGTYVTLPPGITYLAGMNGSNRYVTNAMVANWAKANAGLTFTHTAIATGDKFPDALAAGPYLAKDGGILLLSPLNGPLPAPIGSVLTANRNDIQQFTFIAMIEPVVGQVKALLP